VEGAGYFQCGDSLRDDEYHMLEVETLLDVTNSLQFLYQGLQI